jgi:hypothetical protein
VIIRNYECKFAQALIKIDKQDIQLTIQNITLRMAAFSSGTKQFKTLRSSKTMPVLYKPALLLSSNRLTFIGFPASRRLSSAAILLFLLAIINFPSVIFLLLHKSSYDIIVSRLNMSIVISYSSTSLSMLAGLLYSNILQAKGIEKVDTATKARQDEYLDKLSKYVPLAKILKEDYLNGELIEMHICQLTVKVSKATAPQCFLSVPKDKSMTMLQTEKYLMFQFGNVLSLVQTQNWAELDRYLTSEEFMVYDELNFYLTITMRYTTDAYLNQILIEVTSTGKGVTPDVIIYTILLICLFILYKWIWLKRRKRVWHQIQKSLLVLNDQIIAKNTLRQLLKI